MGGGGLLDEDVAVEAEALDQARHWLEELTKRQPANPSAFLNLAAVYFKQATYAKAIEAVERSLALRPGYGPAEALLNQLQKVKGSGDAAHIVGAGEHEMARNE